LAQARLGAHCGPILPPAWPAAMGYSNSEMKVVVKNTFLECVAEEEEEPQPRILKAKTDPAALHQLRQATSAAAQCGEASAAIMTAAAAVATARTASVAAGIAAEHPADVAAGCPDDLCKALEAPGIVCAPDPGQAEAKQRQQPPGGFAAAPRASPVRAEAPAAATPSERQMTTIMLRNLPNDYTRSMLLQLLDRKGFAGKYDFIYLPTDFARSAGLGYAFVNLVTVADAQLIRKRLEGFRQWIVPSSKVCTVGWSHPCQGLGANIERYRNSPIMHECVPDEFKPMLFKDGLRVEFPKPTKRIRKPDLSRQGRPKSRQQ